MGYSGFEIETAPPIADERLRALYEYWRALAREAGGLPSVLAFDPLHLPKVLPHIWIVEVEPDSRRFRIRLAGESVNAIYRRNIGGQYFSDVYEPSDVDSIVARYRRCLGQPAIFRATGSVYAAAGSVFSGERIGLPMLGRSGFTDTLLGGTVYGARLQNADAAALVTGDMPAFFAIHAANHQAPDIAGP